MRWIPALLACILALPLVLPAAAAAEGPVTIEDRPGIGHPLLFADTRGDVFRPRTLYLVGPDGTLAATLPKTSDDVRSEDRVSLSRVPVLGPLFRTRLTPDDAARKGLELGRLSRVGDDLVLVLDVAPETLAGLDVALAGRHPREGLLSYRTGELEFGPAQPPAAGGAPAGTAYLYDDLLVLAGAK